MKITILDGAALNPGDLSWAPLNKFGTVTVYPRTAQSEVAKRIADSDAILLNKINITDDILCKCPNLKYIGVQATGYNVIDLDACKKHSVCVTNVPSYSTDAVAQHVFALINAFSNKVNLHSDSVMKGDWIKSNDFYYTKAPLFELSGKILGIFGYGNIGKKVELIAKAYGMKTIVTTRSPNSSIENPVSTEDLFKYSDILTLHAPLTEETKYLVNKKTLNFMKKNAIIINTARGLLVNEKDVRDALNEKKIAGYACDVVSQEPMSKDNPLLGAENCIITPHIAWAALETRQRLLDIVINNLENFIKGSPINRVI